MNYLHFYFFIFIFFLGCCTSLWWLCWSTRYRSTKEIQSSWSGVQREATLFLIIY